MTQAHHIAQALKALQSPTKEKFKDFIALLTQDKLANLTQADAKKLPNLLDSYDKAIIYFTNADHEALLQKAQATEHTNLAFSLIPCTDDAHTKSALIAATKSINDTIPSYNIIFFLSPSHLSIAFATRRYDKRTKYEHRDVIDKITLIKDISLESPHPAHIKNLESIALITPGAIDEYYQAILEALSVEKLNIAFFQAIAGHFLDFCEHITLPTESNLSNHTTESSNIESTPSTAQSTTTKDTKREFALRLISRILFCKFLEKKGLIDSALWDISLSPNYYHEVLEPLFFATLNTPAKERDYGLLDTRIREILDSVPYLNGGLFAPQANGDYYKLENPHAHINTLIVPNHCFEKLFSTLESYHFTLDESTPLSQEVGLDPELLGMVFENLLSVLFTDNKKSDKDLRKATGSYYTPREIVSYMCKSALLESLHTKCGESVSYEALEGIIFTESSTEIAQVAQKQAQTILPHLQSLKILDPACGSGAFPMGMLHEILSLYDKLSPLSDGTHSPYERKLKILQDNIYGVDIQPMATEIARLRCFLSLICDAPREHIEPLPNLEFKFVSANSLIPLPKINDNMLYYVYEKDMQELSNIRQETFGAHNKAEIESKYLTLRDKIAREMLQSTGDTNPILEWNPFDPHSVAGFFDSEWMFGITTNTPATNS